MSEEAVLEIDDVEREPGPAADEAADSGPVTEPEAEPAPAPEFRAELREPSGRRRFLVIEVVSVIVVVGLAVALIVSQVQLSNQDSLNGDRTSAVAAAKTYASDVATYSYRHLPRDFGRVEGESTPSFRKTFERSSGSLTKVLVQYKAVATARVLRAGVESISPSRAVVLLFVNQSVSNTAQGVSTDTNRIVVTLVRSGDRWLLEDMKLV